MNFNSTLQKAVLQGGYMAYFIFVVCLTVALLLSWFNYVKYTKQIANSIKRIQEYFENKNNKSTNV